MNILLLALNCSLNAIASARIEATEESLNVNLEKLARNALALCKIHALQNEYTPLATGITPGRACWNFLIFYEIYNSRQKM